ncbi:MAG: photosystem II reaction center protein Ycf12 [Nodosilinea sp.]
MSFLSSVLNSINFELIAQLTMLGMIVIAGPVIVFLLFLRGGDL